MKTEISKAQIDLFFNIVERLTVQAREAGAPQGFVMDLEVLGKIGDQWLRKFGILVQLKGKAEHQLFLVSRGED